MTDTPSNGKSTSALPTGDETSRDANLSTSSLADSAPELARILKRPAIVTPALFAAAEIHVHTTKVRTRDGVSLATDLWLPPTTPAPTIAARTPYGRANDAYAATFLSLARRGYACVSQDCRGTGDSEPDHWDYYVYEPEDSYDLVDWISRQSWFDGFLGACGGSYVGQVQWQMATHPAMTTIVPDVSGVGVALNTAHLHMFVNAYARTVGKGASRANAVRTEYEAEILDETLATGYFNEPLDRPIPPALLGRLPELADLPPSDAKKRLWNHYCTLSCAERAEFIKQATGAGAITVVEHESLSEIFGQQISHDRHTLPHPEPDEIVTSLHACPLVRTGWYDWGLNDALATWELLMNHGLEPLRSRSRLLIAPSAHNQPGYLEGVAEHPELQHAYTVATNVELLLRWYAAVRADELADWPPVIYYLMGANQWWSADAWPPSEATTVPLYLRADNALSTEQPKAEPPDQYTYDPQDPTPTIGGSILSYVYPAGSVDVAAAQARPDVVTYSTPPLEHAVDVVGPLRLVLYASSSAVDTDFAARLSDVFPDGRALQLQNGLLRARYRNIATGGEPELLEPNAVYKLEIDMWATGNRFKPGHRIRIDISSADFPRFDRNANLGGEAGAPVRATQAIYHDAERPSHILLPVLNKPAFEAAAG